jgi:hypothetical protein
LGPFWLLKSPSRSIRQDLYYEPSRRRLIMMETDQLFFRVEFQASSAARSEVLLMDGDTVQEDDSMVIAQGNSFLFKPKEYGLSWPASAADTIVAVRIRVRDGETTLGQQWRIKVSVLPGVEFIKEPAEQQLQTFPGLPLAFHREVRNAGAPVSYSYRRNGTGSPGPIAAVNLRLMVAGTPAGPADSSLCGTSRSSRRRSDRRFGDSASDRELHYRALPGLHRARRRLDRAILGRLRFFYLA